MQYPKIQSAVFLAIPYYLEGFLTIPYYLEGFQR
jgi:hypothetical protein